MTINTVADLMELLEGIDPETPIRVATQPSYPLAATLSAVTVVDVDDNPDSDEFTSYLWLAASESVSSTESPYAPRAAWDGM